MYTLMKNTLKDKSNCLILSQDDDELERRLNGPGAIAAAAAARVAAPPTSSSARRRPRPGTGAPTPATSRPHAAKASVVGRACPARPMTREPNTDTGQGGLEDILNVDRSSIGLPNGTLCDSANTETVGRGARKTMEGSGGRLDLDSFSAGVEESLTRDVSFVQHDVKNDACFPALLSDWILR